MKHFIHRWLGSEWHGRWLCLFMLMVLLIILFPYLETIEFFERKDTLLVTLHTVITLTILRAVEIKLKQIWLVPLTFLIIAMWWIPRNITREGVLVLGSVVLYSYLIYTIFRYLKRLKRMTRDDLYAIGSLYLLLALIWTMLYEGINLLYPGSFHLYGEPFSPRWSDLFYFSVVTMTTLGYGDITPFLPEARSLAILEVLTGLFFVAIIVSTAVNRRMHEKKESELKIEN